MSGLMGDLPAAISLHQDFRSGDVVLSNETATDRFLMVLSGALYSPHSRRAYGPGEVLQPIAFFAADRYEDLVVAKHPSRVLLIPRDDLHAFLNRQSPLTWVLARSVAMEKFAERRQEIQ